MKKWKLFVLFLLPSLGCFAQTYIPMPTDSAIWRYRVFDNDFGTQVLDRIFFLNGRDTFANGNTYHIIMSRTCRQTGGVGFNPPVVTEVATASDIMYSAMREAGKQVFQLSGSGEDLLYDFNVGVGDSIPAYVGKDKVTGIDSILIDGVYHKRYLTTDTTYFVVEGIGSNRGLIPELNDGTGSVIFYCFTDTPVTWSPDTTVPCTYVYPIGYGLAVSTLNNELQYINVYPMPASDVLHISAKGTSSYHAVILNCIGQEIWSGTVQDSSNIPVGAWSRGLYYFLATSDNMIPIEKNIIIE